MLPYALDGADTIRLRLTDNRGNPLSQIKTLSGLPKEITAKPVHKPLLKDRLMYLDQIRKDAVGAKGNADIQAALALANIEQGVPDQGLFAAQTACAIAPKEQPLAIIAAWAAEEADHLPL